MQIRAKPEPFLPAWPAGLGGGEAPELLLYIVVVTQCLVGVALSSALVQVVSFVLYVGFLPGERFQVV